MQTFTFTLAVDGNAIADKTVTLEPTVRRSLLLPFSHTGGGVVKASVDVRDDLATDNTAWAVLPPPRKIAVMLVSPGNLFLEKVLRTDPQVALEVRTPDQYQGGMGDADVVVLDSVTPPRVGQGRFVFVNAVPPDVPLETLGRIERPTIMDWDRSHPVMRHVEFAKVNIEDALRIRPLAAGRPLVEAVGGPLIYALEEPDRKAPFVGFDLFKTDFPLRVAFPLILSNRLRWLWQLFVVIALALLAIEGLLYWRRQCGGRFTLPSSLGDRWALGLRGALLAVLALTLLKPTVPRWVDRLNVVFLLDHSDSVSLAARERAWRFAAEAIKAMRGHDRARLGGFGEDAVVDQPLAHRTALDPPQAHRGRR